MLRKIHFFYLFILCTFSICIEPIAAQYKKPLDVKKTNVSKLDSIKNQRALTIKLLDAQRKRRTDSLAKIQRYKLSKHFKDSVNKKRLQRTDSIKQVRFAILDAQKQARLRKLDSINLLRNPNYKPQARPLPNTKQANIKINSICYRPINFH